MEWTGYDHARKLWYYSNTTTNTYLYENGLIVAGATPTAGSGGSGQAQTASSHGRGPDGTNSDSSITSAFSNLSLSSYNVAPGSANTPYYQNLPPAVRTDSDGSYVAVNFTHTPTTALEYTINQQSQTPHQTPHQSPPVNAATSGYAQSTSSETINRPSDGELLQNVGREVELNPNADSTPPDFPLLSQGLWPRRILRGSERTHGTQERLKPSFQIRRPGYRFYKRGVVFRVLWPELAGDVGQNITIATTGAFGEQTYYKIRWFVVIREGHNCCTCLPIQTYGGRGVPENKANGHHAIMYTGRDPPPPTFSEMAPTEPPMGEPIRVIGDKPWNTMDPMSRVNFLKLYTVEHNVKVEEFGKVDTNDEWKLMAQFKSHWGIDDAEVLPPARYSRYCDGNTHGPTPSTRMSAYEGSSTAVPSQPTYNDASATCTLTLRDAQLGTSYIATDYQYPSTEPGSYATRSSTTERASAYSPYPTSYYPSYSYSSNPAAAATFNPASASSGNSAYTPSEGYASPGNPTYTAAPYNTGYTPPQHTSYASSAANYNHGMNEDDRQTPRPRRLSESSSDRTRRSHYQRRER